MRNASWTESVSVLDRLTSILGAFGDHKVLGINEIARRAGLPKSTVSRIAAELVEQHWLDRVGNDFFIGLSLVELGRNVASPRLLRELAHPLMTRLRDATGESVQLGVLDGIEVVRVAAAGGKTKLSMSLSLGERIPAHASAMGKALLANSEPYLSAELQEGLVSRTPHTITDFATLQRQLAEARLTQTAVEIDEVALGVSSVASPVFGSEGELVGAIAVVGPSAGFDVAGLGSAVRSASLSLNRRIASDR